MHYCRIVGPFSKLAHHRRVQQVFSIDKFFHSCRLPLVANADIVFFRWKISQVPVKIVLLNRTKGQSVQERNTLLALGDKTTFVEQQEGMYDSSEKMAVLKFTQSICQAKNQRVHRIKINTAYYQRRRGIIVNRVKKSIR